MNTFDDARDFVVRSAFRLEAKYALVLRRMVTPTVWTVTLGMDS